METSIGTLTATYLGGYISDTTGDYSYVFYIAGILLLSGKHNFKKISLNQIGAACAGVVAIRRRCSFGEITEDEPAQSQGPSLLVTPAQVFLC